MKKISVLLMLFASVTILIHCQDSAKKKALDDSVKPVTIYLVSNRVEINDTVKYRLAMFDSNGDIAIDSLTTKVKIAKDIKAKVVWEIQGGIKEITEIKPESPQSILFANGVKQAGNKFTLQLPDEIPQPVIGIREKYYIKYIPMESNDTITIDPFIRVPPEN
jgi:thioredoxin-related protein